MGFLMLAVHRPKHPKSLYDRKADSELSRRSSDVGGLVDRRRRVGLLSIS